jgi:hypothetical protein
MDIKKASDNFRVVLERLSSPASAQTLYLARLGVGPSADELALEFDDIFRPLELHLSRLEGGPELIGACQEINARFASETLGWSIEDLESDEWVSIRGLADEAKRLLLRVVTE